MKKVLTRILAFILALNSILMLGGCSSKSNQILSLGQWLNMVNSTFGMESYTNDEPYFKNINKDNEYFKDFQIAVEWEVIDKDEDIDPQKNLKWREALVTLVNVGEFLPIDSSYSEKVDYAIKHFDMSIRDYWMDRDIDAESAMKLLYIAQEQWANKKYEMVTEETQFKEDIIDFTNKENLVNGYTVKDNQVVIPYSDDIQIQEGAIYVLPSQNQSLGIKTYKAKKITKDDQYIYIDNENNELELDDVVEEIHSSGTYRPTEENTIIYGPNGDVLLAGGYAQQQSSITDEEVILNHLDSSTDIQSYQLKKLGSKIKNTYKIDNCEVTLEYNLDGQFDLKATVESPNLLNNKKTGGPELKGSASVKISDVKISHNIDRLGLKMDSAMLKVDYTTEKSWKMELSGKPVDKVVAPKYSNGNGKYLTNLKNRKLKDLNDKGAKTIKLGSINVFSTGAVRVCLDVNLKISCEGSVSLTLTEHGTKGVEYKNKNIRFINSIDKDVDVELKAGIEATVGLGPALYTVGLKKKIIGFQITFGIGGKASATAHLADNENHLLEEITGSDIPPEYYEVIRNLNIVADTLAIITVAQSQGGIYHPTADEVPLHTDVCIDVSAYIIFRIGLSDESLVTDLSNWLGKELKLSVEIFGEKNAKFFNMHVDNFDFASGLQNIGWGSDANKKQCIFEYVPFDKEDSEKEASEDNLHTNDTILKGNGIILSQIKLTVPQDGQNSISLQQIPNNYSLNDIIWESNDPNIASIDSNGVIIGKKEGNALIVVSTKDQKYKAYCAVTVVADKKNTFTPL